MGAVNFLYNPERKSKSQLIDEFVIRQDLLKLIMEDLLTSPMKTPEQHYLLVGQRGTGKTTLLHRIRYAIEDAPSLKNWLIPVIFSEEQYNISELANLWENIGQELEDYHEFNGLYKEMEKAISPTDYDERCWDILESALDSKGKKIVLLIDNIGDLLEKFSDLEIRRLRRILQTKPQLRLIAASPLYLESILDYTQPLFEFFKVLRLENLDSRETHELLLTLADIHGDKEKIEQIIKKTPERVETLRTLTGGVPRTIALMFNIFIEQEHEHSLKDLEKILDVVTPLYKHRMDDLPHQQQKIVDAVAKYWDPINVKTLKDRVRLESKVISAQLRQLEKDQVIQKLGTDTKNNEYLLRERFFNIWYLMRYGRKEDKQRVIWLVRFLESWCTDREIENRVVNFVEQLKNKKIEGKNVDFFSEVYTSISKLSAESKLLLRDHVAPRYGKSLYVNDEEINKSIKESFWAGDYRKTVHWLSMLEHLTEDNKETVYELAKKSIEKGIDIGIYFHQIHEVVWKWAMEGVMPSNGAIQLHNILFILKSQTYINFYLEKENYDKIVDVIRDQLTGLGDAIFLLGMDYFEKYNFELLLLLTGIRALYSKGQINILKRIFEQDVPENENKLPLADIFNPIYLALKTLDPDAGTINIAPERQKVIQQVRDYITNK